MRKRIEIKIIKGYLSYKIDSVYYVNEITFNNLLDLGVAVEVVNDKPKRGRKPKNKEELKDSIETK
jgi:hypothetical protein